jgi:hypothetical protein
LAAVIKMTPNRAKRIKVCRGGNVSRENASSAAARINMTLMNKSSAFANDNANTATP